MVRNVLGVGVALVLCVSCGGGEASDAGIDAAPDAALDAGRDAESDAGVDAGGDAGDAGCTDADGDGHGAIACGGDDCDDADASRYPGNHELCDSMDHDEDCDAVTFGFRDEDSDGVPDILCCNTDGAGAMHCGTDCNDANANIHPAQTETCNGIDDNCDGMIDEGALVSYVADCDHDGYGAGTPMLRCTPPAVAPPCGGGMSIAVGGDCDDGDALRSPGHTEVCDRAGFDEDCDPSTLGPDADADGFAGDVCCDTQPDGTLLCGTDCDDSRASVLPGGVETCNFADDDCNGTIDDGLGSCASDPASGQIACGVLVCSLATSVCCTTAPGVSPGQLGCDSIATDPCPMSRPLRDTCDGPEDCAGTGVCAVTPSGTSCVPATDGERLCHHDSQCPLPTTCVPRPFVMGVSHCS